MTREDIIRMGAESKISLYSLGKEKEKFINYLESFAALVASAERERLTDAAMKAAEKAVDVAIALEREACAKVCEDLYAWNMDDPASTAAKAIRARGQA